MREDAESVAQRATSTQLRAERLDGEARRLASVVRNLLTSVNSTHYAKLLEATGSPASDKSGGSHGDAAVQLEELIDVLAAELSRKASEASAARVRAEQLESALQERAAITGEWLAARLRPC